MPSTSTDIFLDDGDHFTAGSTSINGTAKHTARLGSVRVSGSLATLSLLRD